MAIQQQQTLPAPFIEEAGKDYLGQLKGLTSVPLDTSRFASGGEIKIRSSS